MADQLIVKPVEGATLPLEGLSTLPKRFTVDRAMRVPNSRYYRRALRRGDIALGTEAEVEAATKAADDAAHARTEEAKKLGDQQKAAAAKEAAEAKVRQPDRQPDAEPAAKATKGSKGDSDR